jgi:hypothetical protein
VNLGLEFKYRSYRGETSGPTLIMREVSEMKLILIATVFAMSLFAGASAQASTCDFERNFCNGVEGYYFEMARDCTGNSSTTYCWYYCIDSWDGFIWDEGYCQVTIPD